MSEFISVERHDRVCVVKIDRPAAKNALTQDMYGAIADALFEADKNKDIRAVLLTSDGELFTAGNDLRDFQSERGEGEAPVGRFLRAIRDVNVPFIISVNGPSIGVGLTMLLHADLVIAGERATFKAPFAQIGVVPEAGSSLLLPQAVGMAWANDILLTGRALTAQEALSIGLISRVYPDGDLAAEAMQLAMQVSQMPPNAMLESKKLIRAGRDAIIAQMEKEMVAFGNQLRSAEFKEAATAFFEKRAPVFD